MNHPRQTQNVRRRKVVARVAQHTDGPLESTAEEIADRAQTIIRRASWDGSQIDCYRPTSEIGMVPLELLKRLPQIHRSQGQRQIAVEPDVQCQPQGSSLRGVQQRPQTGQVERRPINENPCRPGPKFGHEPHLSFSALVPVDVTAKNLRQISDLGSKRKAFCGQRDSHKKVCKTPTNIGACEKINSLDSSGSRGSGGREPSMFGPRLHTSWCGKTREPGRPPPSKYGEPNVMSLARLSAGAGYQYLLRHTACGDVERNASTPLTAYYTSAGYPPGRWTGSGLDGLGNGEGIRAGSPVIEEQMAALYGKGREESGTFRDSAAGIPFPTMPWAVTIDLCPALLVPL